MKNKQFIGNNIVFIPLRGGSKSIPLKNIKLLNGRPLVYWVIDASHKCEDVSTIVISTDNDQIKEVVKRYKSDKILIIDRSEEVSTDNASTESTMIEFANYYSFNNIALIQATSPLLTNSDIKKGFDKIKQKGIDSVLSVVRQKRFIWENKYEGSRAVNYDPEDRPRRQDFDGFLVENGAFYITSYDSLLKTHCRISGNIGLIEMIEESYFEIDEPTDWAIVETLLSKYDAEINCDYNKLSKIKCLLSDCDGVMTDGGMYYSEFGDEVKKFNTRDGMSFALLREKGYITGIVSGENTDLVRRRAEKINVDCLYLGIKEKIKVIEEICDKYNLKFEEIAYIGDDINDLEVITRVGFGCVVNDGMSKVKTVADYITKLKGGEGAVREVADLLLASKI